MFQNKTQDTLPTVLGKPSEETFNLRAKNNKSHRRDTSTEAKSQKASELPNHVAPKFRKHKDSVTAEEVRRQDQELRTPELVAVSTATHYPREEGLTPETPK